MAAAASKLSGSITQKCGLATEFTTQTDSRADLRNQHLNPIHRLSAEQALELVPLIVSSDQKADDVTSLPVRQLPVTGNLKFDSVLS